MSQEQPPSLNKFDEPTQQIPSGYTPVSAGGATYGSTNTYGARQPQYEVPSYPGRSDYVPTNAYAIIALCTSLTAGVVGLIFGILARKQIAQTGERGSGLALAGIIIGSIWSLFALLYLFFILFAVGASIAGTGY